MPAPEHPMRDIVRHVIANHPEWGPEPIRDHLEWVALDSGAEEADLASLPSTSTIGRIKREFPEEGRREYTPVRWPESFAAGLLPWEAARALLALTVEGEVVTVQQARWYWRVIQAAPPDAPAAVLLQLAKGLAADERAGGIPPARARSAEMYLALRGWEAPVAYRERLASDSDAPEPWDTSERRVPAAMNVSRPGSARTASPIADELMAKIREARK